MVSRYVLTSLTNETVLVPAHPSLSPGPFHLGVGENIKREFVGWRTIMLPLISKKKRRFETVLLAECCKVHCIGLTTTAHRNTIAEGTCNTTAKEPSSVHMD
ncbi:uncharacterized protein BT62DRAFT_553279 [Guyanagaster necrorhizus]|uniref:Uncharacterized protein n=1 Tax=Guyanagaster necrorhizus TaxID=856835 RepID=A0A9P8AMR9_9AGAR|nr:uncharacterized protein BT62DRAFT_553279 [Guyanagaster necrorhizus MCA 3950]KAG7441185.1 hypothetical protein BT62DRAFT_553279 [Guyanagaster necrorhizus MCA 3950]